MRLLTPNVAATILIALLNLMLSSANLEKSSVIFRQCRWSPFTANNMNGVPRLMVELTNVQMSKALFQYDDMEKWKPYINNDSDLTAGYYSPKWIYRNSGTQILIAAAMLVNELKMDYQCSKDPYHVTPWNMLLCGMYKQGEITSEIIDQMSSDTHVPELIDYIFQIARCVQSDPDLSSCPDICHASAYTRAPCSSIPRAKTRNSCRKYFKPEYLYTPFSGAKLDEISKEQFDIEAAKFQQWHDTMSEDLKIPFEIFAANFESDRLVRIAAYDLPLPDIDDKRVSIDSEFKALRNSFIKSGCQAQENSNKPKCIKFRAVLHTKLVKLQQHLAADRSCKCILGFSWEPDTQSCQSQLLGFCADSNPCMNDGVCEAQPNLGDSGSHEESSVRVHCTCPVAWAGTICELENNICEQLPSSSTCGQHECRRSTIFTQGYECVCSPQFYRRKSTSDPHCEDINECVDPNFCLNDGVCENKDPGFICKCREGFTGAKCEVSTGQAVWSAWQEWSSCHHPQPAFHCTESQWQERKRTCQSSAPALSCSGPRREVRYFCPTSAVTQSNVPFIACTSTVGNVSKFLPPSSFASLQEQFVIHDHEEFEEAGRFSRHELRLVIRDESAKEYYIQAAFMMVVISLSISSIVGFFWLYSKFLRGMLDRQCKFFIGKIVSHI